MSEKVQYRSHSGIICAEAVKDVDIASAVPRPSTRRSYGAGLARMHVTDVTWDETEPGFANAVDAPIKMGESTPHIESPSSRASNAAHGF